MIEDSRRDVLFKLVEDRTWIPELSSEEESLLLDMAEMGWVDTNPDTPSGIGVTERGYERYHSWGGAAA